MPFRAAITAGAKLVMLSWATYPALDPQPPASLSAAVIQGELRDRLGFRGVTITDAISAGALTRFGTLGARGMRAAEAGVDLILRAATNPTTTPPRTESLSCVCSSQHSLTISSASPRPGRLPNASSRCARVHKQRRGSTCRHALSRRCAARVRGTVTAVASH